MNRRDIRRIESGWGGAIVDVHRRAFPRETTKLTILACAGASRYLESLLAFPRFQSEHLFVGAVEREHLVGYAHFRQLPDSFHLNNLAVIPERSGSGIGTDLLRGWDDEGRRRRVRKLSLDVDAANTVAVEWYQRRGFIETARKWVYRRPLRVFSEGLDDGASRRLDLVGWEGAEAWQCTYGFSSFGLRCGNMVWRFGRLGSDLLRSSGRFPSWVELPLIHLCPQRDLLSFLDEAECETAGRLIAVRVRMERELA